MSASENGYLYDCVLNDEDKQSAVCSYQCDEYPTAEIASMMSLTEDQVTYLLTLCGDSCPLAPSDITLICNLKNLGMSVEDIVKNAGFTEDEVTTTIADNCSIAEHEE